MTTEDESPKEQEHPLSLAAVAPLGVVAAALVTWLIVFAGWRYTTEYCKAFGIEPGALDFSPYDYALRGWRSVAQLIWAVAIPFFPLLVLRSAPGVLFGRDRVILSLGIRWARIIELALFSLTLTGVVTLFWGIASDDITVPSIGFICVLAGAFGLTLYGAWQKRVLITVAGILFGAVSVFAMTTATAANSGNWEAFQDQQDVKRLPGISIVARSELGLDHQGEAAGLPVYGPYRLVLHNGGMYYVVAEDNPYETIAVPEDAIVFIKLKHGGY
jgi:hypothetical protein